MFSILPGLNFTQTIHIHYACYLHEREDLVACLDGDDLILHETVSTVVSSNLGSLGFFTAHHFIGFRRDLESIIHGNITTDGVYVTLKMRLGNGIFHNGYCLKVRDGNNSQEATLSLFT